jgi:hypothetical protein
MRKVIFAINITLDGCCDHTKHVPDELDSGELSGEKVLLENLEHGSRHQRDQTEPPFGQSAGLRPLTPNGRKKPTRICTELAFLRNLPLQPNKAGWYRAVVTAINTHS